MKNIFYFNEDYEMTLLLNEECDHNCIHIVIDANDAADQKLEIKVKGSASGTIPITAGTRNAIELKSDYWAVDGATTFRFVNTTTACDWHMITFPSDIVNDMMINECGSCEYKVNCQNTNGINVDELKLIIVPYVNGRDYTIKANPIKIVDINYTGTTKTDGIFMATILLTAEGITDVANLKFTLRINKMNVDVFIPVQTITNGQHIINITYPILNIVKYDANSLLLYATVSEGTVKIAQQKLRAEIIANGLKESTEWNGIIEVEEYLEPLDIKLPYNMTNMVDNVAMTSIPPHCSAFNETVNIAIDNPISLKNMDGNVNITFEEG